MIVSIYRKLWCSLHKKTTSSLTSSFPDLLFWVIWAGLSMHTKNPHLKWSILQIFSEMMSNLMLTLRYILNEYDELIWKEVCQLSFLLIFDIDLASLHGAYWGNLTVFWNSLVSLQISCSRWLRVWHDVIGSHKNLNSLVSIQLHGKCLDGRAWCDQY